MYREQLAIISKERKPGCRHACLAMKAAASSIIAQYLIKISAEGLLGYLRSVVRQSVYAATWHTNLSNISPSVICGEKITRIKFVWSKVDWPNSKPPLLCRNCHTSTSKPSTSLDSSAITIYGSTPYASSKTPRKTGPTKQNVWP